MSEAKPAIQIFSQQQEINRLNQELAETKTELRMANAYITNLRNKYEILEIEVGVLRESRASDEEKVEDRLRQQLLAQRKEISDLKAALRFEVFDDDTGTYKPMD